MKTQLLEATEPATTTVRSSEYEAELVLERKEAVSEDVIALTLRDAAGRSLPEWTPGAHVDVLLPGDIVRQYSLCGDPADRSSWRIAILRDPKSRGGSMFIHDDLQEGDRLRVRGPRNNFELVPSQRYLFIAGGVGITPLLAMAAAAEAAGAQWQLAYGGRRRNSMAYLSELAQYGDRVTVHPQEESGLLDLQGLLGTPQPNTKVYCCGPEPLLLAVEEQCQSWPAGSLHIERFAPRKLSPTAVDTSFEVVLDHSGITLTVPTDKSILRVVEDAGIDVPSSCEEGTCGTCETSILEGEPEHRDSVLSEEGRTACRSMMICVSRCAGRRLVLDL
jgi:ferredoxin-NADP reductase